MNHRANPIARPPYAAFALECPDGGPLVRDAAGREVTVGCGRLAQLSFGSPSSDVAHVGGATAIASQLPVGLALSRPVLCVSYDVTLRTAARLLEREPSPFGLAVVAGDGAFIGVLARARVALALAKAGGQDAAVAGSMVFASAFVSERATLDDAFAAMTRRRARELLVLGEDREVTGVLRDVDALRFVAHVARTGLRPPPSTWAA